MVKLFIIILMSLVPLITFMTELIDFGLFWLSLIIIYMLMLGAFTYLQTGDKKQAIKYQSIPIVLLLLFFFSFGFEGIGGEPMSDTLSHVFMVVFIVIYFSPVIIYIWLLSKEIKGS